MKTIYLLFLLLFTGLFTGLFAQNRVVQRVEDYVTIRQKNPNLFSIEPGGMYIQYYITDEYDDAPNESVHLDTIIHSTRSLIAPVFDSVLTTMTLAESYTIYSFKKNKKSEFVTAINTKNEQIQLLAPVYKVKKEQVLVEDGGFYFINRFPSPANCVYSKNGSFILQFAETPPVYMSIYKKICTVPPRIVNGQNDTIIITEQSPYFKYFEIKKIPAQTVEVWKYTTKNKYPSFLTTDTIIMREIVGKKLVRRGGWAELKKVFCCSGPNPLSMKGVQLALKAKGFYKGKIDGVMGEETKKALNKFQIAKKLPVGNFDFATLKALEVDKYTPPYKEPPLPPEAIAFNAALAKYRWNNSPKLLFDPNTEAIKMLRLLGEAPLLQGFSEEQVKEAKREK
jgi:Putative peptidoglycan binding domain